MRDRAVITAVLFAAFIADRGKRVPWGDGWYWPVPSVRMPDGHVYDAGVTNEFKRDHYGVDIMFRDAAGAYFAPPGTPITAARAGRVWNVAKTARGWTVVLDHGKPFATFYQHLQSVAALGKGMPVAAGQRLGVMGIDPTDPQRVRHLHFAVWFDGMGDGASVDPSPVIGGWRRPATWDA